MDEVDRVAGTLGRAVGHLLSLQDDAGWWKGDLETNTTMDSEDLMLRHWLGIWDPKQAELTARFIRPQQNPDGSWPIYHGGPGDLAATVESYIALRMVGDSPDAPHMRAAAAWARARGGVPATRVFTRIWLALFGWWRWEDLPVLPPELMFVPAKMPLSIYRFASWGRQTIVAIMVLMAHRPTGIPPSPTQALSPAPAAPAGRRRGRCVIAVVPATGGNADEQREHHRGDHPTGPSPGTQPTDHRKPPVVTSPRPLPRRRPLPGARVRPGREAGDAGSRTDRRRPVKSRIRSGGRQRYPGVAQVGQSRRRSHLSIPGRSGLGPLTRHDASEAPGAAVKGTATGAPRPRPAVTTAVGLDAGLDADGRPRRDRQLWSGIVSSGGGPTSRHR
ncbi:hypothetical protein I6A84_28710 [Frankia sp. CNm7]|nr:hypothetical protein [Frankia nepalensis]